MAFAVLSRVAKSGNGTPMMVSFFRSLGMSLYMVKGAPKELSVSLLGFSLDGVLEFQNGKVEFIACLGIGLFHALA